MLLHNATSLLIALAPNVPTDLPRPESAPAPHDLNEPLWAPLGRDGGLMLYLRGGEARSDRLFIPAESGELIDASEQAGLAQRPGARAAVAADLDGDGRSELLRLPTGGGFEVLRLDAGGTLHDVTGEFGLSSHANLTALRVLDFDGDGNLDLELQTPSHLAILRNDDGTFVPALEVPRTSAPGQAANRPTADMRPVAEEGARVAGEPDSDMGRTRPEATDGPTIRAGVRPSPERDAGSGRSSGVSAPDDALASPICLQSIRDQASGECLRASSMPAIGKLHPLSMNFHLDPFGNVNMGAASSVARLTTIAGTNGTAIHGSTLEGTGVGVVGDNLATRGTAVGVSGRTHSSTGSGVRGEAIATTGSPVGVLGTTTAPDGIAVRGDILNSSGTGTGVLGRTFSAGGRAILGHAAAATGSAQGVVGLAESPSASAIYGEARATTGTPIGVEGVSEAPDGLGILGFNTSATGPAIGVEGRSQGTIGIGVQGTAPGLGTGVRGESGSGQGVYALAPGAGGFGSLSIGGDVGAIGFSDTSKLFIPGSGLSGSSANPGAAGTSGVGEGTTPGVFGLCLENGSGVRGTAVGSGGSDEFLQTVGVRGSFEQATGSGTGILAEATAAGASASKAMSRARTSAAAHG